ncbi:hypothetical protein SAMN06298210_11524 [Prevotellaceae bacterium KH2P17]|nr:hypothetical protein SAMN06298210_11524 [Prevotellaceae bacterium KH2P17]
MPFVRFVVYYLLYLQIIYNTYGKANQQNKRSSH